MIDVDNLRVNLSPSAISIVHELSSIDPISNLTCAGSYEILDDLFEKRKGIGGLGQQNVPNVVRSLFRADKRKGRISLYACVQDPSDKLVFP